ncbi:MAG TPA: hypothetical protein VGH37_07565, partial [Candidatus Acidoferrum sp.]
FGMDIQTYKFYSLHRPAPSLVALYCLSSDSQHNPRLRIAAGHSIVTSVDPVTGVDSETERRDEQWTSTT